MSNAHKAANNFTGNMAALEAIGLAEEHRLFAAELIELEMLSAENVLSVQEDGRLLVAEDAPNGAEFSQDARSFPGLTIVFLRRIGTTSEF